MKSKKPNMRGDGADHAVKLGKHSKVKAGPSYKFPGKVNMARSLYTNKKAEAQT